MLIVKETSEGAWVTRKIRGVEIRLRIRPRNEDISEQITKRHTKTEFVKDPSTKQMVKTKTTDNQNYLEDMIDYYLEDFEGIGSAPDKPWPVDKRNKLRVAMLPVIEGEQPVFDFIMEKSLELSFADSAEEKQLVQD